MHSTPLAHVTMAGLLEMVKEADANGAQGRTNNAVSALEESSIVVECRSAPRASLLAAHDLGRSCSFHFLPYLQVDLCS